MGSQPHLLHISGLSKIIKGEIDRIVEMAEHVDIVKSELCLYLMNHIS